MVESRPDENRLYQTAAAQEGLFTTAQAAEAGYSPQLLAHHLGKRRVERVRRGVYRLVRFPPGEHEDLVAVWLWSESQGVFSHETALSLQGLSDVLPAKAHLTLPRAWKSRRLRFPHGVVPHYADVPRQDRIWVGAIPVTSAARTVVDCATARLSPDLLRQALEEGLEQGLFSADMVTGAREYLDAFDPSREVE